MRTGGAKTPSYAGRPSCVDDLSRHTLLHHDFFARVEIGYEAAGTVAAVGPGGEGFKVGDAVSTIPAFSMNQYGVYGDS